MNKLILVFLAVVMLFSIVRCEESDEAAHDYIGGGYGARGYGYGRRHHPHRRIIRRSYGGGRYYHNEAPSEESSHEKSDDANHDYIYGSRVLLPGSRIIHPIHPIHPIGGRTTIIRRTIHPVPTFPHRVWHNEESQDE